MKKNGKTIPLALCLTLIAACAKNESGILPPESSTEECVTIQEAYFPRQKDFFNSEEYRKCRDAALSMEPNAGAAMLNALDMEGESLTLVSDIEDLEKKLFFCAVGNNPVCPSRLQTCYEVSDTGRCKGVFADDSERLDSALLPSRAPEIAKGGRITLCSKKPNYILKSLFIDKQPVPFRQTGPAEWEVRLPVAPEPRRENRSGIRMMIAVFQWNGTGSPASSLGTFRKAVWYY